MAAKHSDRWRQILVIEQIAGRDAECQIVTAATGASAEDSAPAAPGPAETAKASVFVPAFPTSTAAPAAIRSGVARTFESLTKADRFANAKVDCDVCWSLAQVDWDRSVGLSGKWNEEALRIRG